MTGAAEELRFLPVGLDLRDKVAVVVGGGAVGTRKALTLARTGADVRVIAPEATVALTEAAEQGRVSWVREAWREQGVDGAFLVVAATDDPAVNASVVASARSAGALVCDASSAERSDVIFGALLTRDDATIAVFTDGRDPSRARSTRDELAESWP